MPGTAYVLFHHVMGETNGKRGVWGYVRGGMGGLTQALAAAARDLGADIRCDAEVARILVRDGAAAGVALAGGDEFYAPVVASNADAHVTFLTLLDRDVAARSLRGRRRADQLRQRLAKDQRGPGRAAELPARCRARSPGRSIAARSTSVPTRTTSSARSTTPSTAARRGARARMHDPLGGRPDGRAARAASDVDVRAVRTVRSSRGLLGRPARDRSPIAASTCWTSTHPNFKRSVLHRQVLTPVDLERVFNLTGGNIFQGAMTPGQLFAFRPVPGYAGYRTPVRGLYLCGAAAHPGGGVMGTPGLNAAREILGQRRLRALRGSRHAKTRRSTRPAEDTRVSADRQRDA